MAWATSPAGSSSGASVAAGSVVAAVGSSVAAGAAVVTAAGSVAVVSSASSPHPASEARVTRETVASARALRNCFMGSDPPSFLEDTGSSEREDKLRIERGTPRREPPLPRGLVFALEPGDRTCRVEHTCCQVRIARFTVAGQCRSSNRTSLGSSEATIARHRYAPKPMSDAPDPDASVPSDAGAVARRSAHRRPPPARAARRRLVAAGQHRRRQGQELGGVRRDGAGDRSWLEGRGGAVREERRLEGRRGDRSVATSASRG